MSCPYLNDTSEEDQKQKLKEGDLSYTKYLQLEKLLSCQKLQSEEQGNEIIHDEHLFIITHQAYELWFSQVIYEIDSIRTLFENEFLNEGKMLEINKRLSRVVTILKLCVDQFSILETMTPLDFMDFRVYLSSGSGFQSLQFRLIENKLGMKQEHRVKYNLKHYKEVFKDSLSLDKIEKSIQELSLHSLVDRWLSRTPGLEVDGYFFWHKYQSAVEQWLYEEYLSVSEKESDNNTKQTLIAEYNKLKKTFDSVFEVEIYNDYIERGDRRLSHEAFQGAMMISLFRDEPRFHLPFQLLTLLMDIDSSLMKWRYNHVMLVQRTLGSKQGTGGSSGYQYLRSTVSDRYKIFLDFFNLSTYIIPRKFIPPLSSAMKHRLSIIEAMVELAERHHQNSQERKKNANSKNTGEKSIGFFESVETKMVSENTKREKTGINRLCQILEKTERPLESSNVKK